MTEGLIGPQENDRLWSRHLLNCAVVAELIPAGAILIDVGSGAGCPGIPLALARPDLAVHLVEASARRAAFLIDCVTALAAGGSAALGTVHQGRAEEGHVRRGLPRADVVTARAVAPLDRLAGWCLPLLRPGGRLLAVKGASASEELERCRPTLARYGAERATVHQCGAGIVEPMTTVVELTRR